MSLCCTLPLYRKKAQWLLRYLTQGLLPFKLLIPHSVESPLLLFKQACLCFSQLCIKFSFFFFFLLFLTASKSWADYFSSVPSLKSLSALVYLIRSQDNNSFTTCYYQGQIRYLVRYTGQKQLSLIILNVNEYSLYYEHNTLEKPSAFSKMFRWHTTFASK